MKVGGHESRKKDIEIVRLAQFQRLCDRSINGLTSYRFMRTTSIIIKLYKSGAPLIKHARHAIYCPMQDFVVFLFFFSILLIGNKAA